MRRFRSDLVVQVSETEAHRMIKIWRALWKKMAWFGFPRVGPRSRPCLHQLRPEAAERRLVRGRGGAPDQRSLASEYQGLAALLAVGWESQLSPVDVRKLRVGDMRRDPIGTWFEVASAKTGREALATLSQRTTRLLRAYMASFAAEPMDVLPIFVNRSGAPYSKDTLGGDFPAVRGNVSDPKTASSKTSAALAQSRRWNVPPAKLSSNMANTLSDWNSSRAPAQSSRMSFSKKLSC